MSRSKIAPFALAMLFGLATAVPAFADGEHGDAKEVGALMNAKITAADAVATAEKESGGRAVKVELEKEKGAYLFEVKTVSQDQVARIMIDPATGKTVKVEKEGSLEKIFDRDEQDDLKKLNAVPTTLSAAIAAGEKNIAGKAVEAGIDEDADGAIFKVEVVKDNVVHRVMIDGADGKVLRVTAKNDEDDD